MTIPILTPDPDRLIGGRRASWTVYIAFWTLLAFVSSSTNVVVVGEAAEFNWLGYAAMHGGYWLIWAVAMPSIYRLCFTRSGWQGPVAVGALVAANAVLLGLIVLAAHFYFMAVNSLALGLGDFGWPAFLDRLLDGDKLWFNAIHLIKYVVVCCGCVFLRQARLRAREEQARQQVELRNRALEAELARSRLAALREQVHPHFIFNALNCVAGLIEAGENDNAYTAVTRIGELLRRTLAFTERDWVPLSEELDLTRTFLTIAKIRFGDRLDWHDQVAVDCLDIKVPPFLIQPLAENAVRHAVEPATGPVTVNIDVARVDGNLQVIVADNGPGFSDPGRAVAGRGIGLRNLRQRLELLYGPAQRLDIGPTAGGGAEVRILVPEQGIGA